MIDDVFCKIISGEFKGDIVYRDDEVVVIRDIHPQAPVHLLVMPVRHVDGLADASEALMGKLLSVAHKVADQEGLSGGYRIILNEGEDGGKLVPHLHLHLLGGKRLGPKIVSD
jgi:histidine triad (HIT) family protein